MSVKREQLREGVCVRLLSDWITVPAGTTGTIDSVMVNSGFLPAVMWDAYLALPVFLSFSRNEGSPV